MTKMRANRASFDQRDRADVGIGTMIVFIATVLVAAIAAAVLIDTSGKLQERSTRTGQETTQQVASNLKVETVIGLRNSSASAGINETEVYVTLAPGASAIDLGQLRITIQNGTIRKILNYTATNQTNENLETNRFNATAIRDADGSFSSNRPVITSGDLVKILISLWARGTGFPWEPRDQIEMTLIPEVGNQVQVGFQTPASYGSDLVITLV